MECDQFVFKDNIIIYVIRYPMSDERFSNVR
jgi:hypothetical protein